MLPTIRTAIDADILPIADLWHAGWHDAHSAIVIQDLVRLRTLDSFQDRTRHHISRTRCADLSGALVGFCTIREDELFQLYVAAQARGKGVAQLLMADGEQRLAESGIERAWLSCAIGNERAARFYTKCGWTLMGTEPEFVESSAGPYQVEIWRFEKDMQSLGG